jgi:glucosamine-phosphate N-acetyltransferase
LHYGRRELTKYGTQIRPLASDDYHRGHLPVLRVLTSAPDMGLPAYQSAFAYQKSLPNTYFTLVILSKETDTIVGVGCVFIELKFMHNLGKVGHIEDIAVDKNQQGKKLGLRIIQALTEISEAQGVYKTILNCSDANIRGSHQVLPFCSDANNPFTSFLPKMRLRKERKRDGQHLFSFPSLSDTNILSRRNTSRLRCTPLGFDLPLCTAKYLSHGQHT